MPAVRTAPRADMKKKKPVNSTPPEVSRAAGIGLTLGAVALTALVGAGVGSGVLPTGAPDWFWRWRAGGVLPWGAAATVAVLTGLLAALLVGDRLRTPAPPTRSTCALLLTALVLLGLVLTLAVALQDPLYPATAGLTVLSDLAIGYYTVAIRLPALGEAFSQHVSRAENPAVPDRVRTHPPGPILLMRALRELGLMFPQALERLEDYLERTYGANGERLAQLARMGTAQTLSPLDALIAVPVGLVLTALTALLVLPAYGLGAVLADRRVGLVTAVLALTIPSLLCFVPGIDGIGAVLGLTVLYLWAAALRGGEWWLYLLAGLGAAVTLLWSFGYAVLVVPAALLALPRGQWRPVRLGQGLVFTTAGLAVVYGVLDAGLGYSLPAAMSASLGAQKEIMAREQRPYLTWLWLNPYSWAVFAGPGLLLLAIAAWFGPGLRETGLGRLAQGVAVTLALLTLAGTTRGEVERIWVFLMPAAALPAAWWLGRMPKPAVWWAITLLVLSQVGLALTFHAVFDLVKPY